MIEVATKADLSTTEADLPAKTIDLKAAIEAEKRRLTRQLGGVLVANLIAMGLLLFGQACS
jgi:hypothetical protein